LSSTLKKFFADFTSERELRFSPIIPENKGLPKNPTLDGRGCMKGAKQAFIKAINPTRGVPYQKQ